ncbi:MULTISPECIES: L-lactate dehydrogenase (quinone) large subunit LdhH [unclassified Candidatus Frackibacter]|uniref:L-lactate dehydrogenase (quinone) large subunit LdhH n=1 Tax=unclassified Candidatus Frackibacter TaxID=2648818 RepID=UPI000886E198|nr:MULTISPECIES: LUD domain-containing protein [unclassified Candidatus Frackibacter]SDC15244.1 iron-sulfur cluster-binding protein [Candidatus Frackibacter sp. WG11]SEM46474.1 iron-sulfur cluster-binding protein [Candidatus Frackibacter sp. WG12]SFL48416.1 iron-sulfur cluster-binding protein [Candidatus Frackibacter sp. WG13]
MSMLAKKELTDNIKKALNNENLRSALGSFADGFVQDRNAAYEDEDFEALRKKVREARDYAVEHLDELADKFQEEAEKRGAIVYRAKDAQDANQYIQKLCEEKGVETVVKSKSMATEEIFLNKHLEKHDIDITETDLGEWILQLQESHPSHMVMPAIHLKKEEVADLFSEEVGYEVSPEVEGQVELARQELRKKFLSAGMGITGGNLAIAETGTIALVTNEGNARLTTTLPPIHVAVVGYEKLIAKFEDAIAALKALPRSATAQHITSYVTMVTGQVPTIVEGEEGKKELHIILLDNGRREMLSDPTFKQAARCLRCASCLNVCPIYKQVGGHVYGHVYAGGIGSILTAFFHGYETSDDVQEMCIGCRRCAEFCPGNINIPDLILELRRRLTEKRGLPFIFNVGIKGILGNSRLMHTGLKLASKFQGPITDGDMIRHLPLAFSEITECKSLPKIADKPFRDQIKNINQKVDSPTETVAFYAGCAIDFAYPEVGTSLVKVLNKENIKVEFPQTQACCGVPAKYLGDMETMRKLAKQNIKALEGSYDHIITACPTCAEAVIEGFAEALAGEPEWQRRAKKVASKVKDFSQYLANKGYEVGDGTKKRKVTYHDSCHLTRSLRLQEKPREVLKSSNNIDFVEMRDSDICCGFGGSYSFKHPNVAKEVLKDKLDNVEATGADTLAMDCPGCLMQLKGGADKHGVNIDVKHTAEILAENL